MDVIEKLEREHPNLNWADWMDAIQQDSFEKNVLTWTRKGAGAVKSIVIDTPRPTDTGEVPEPV